MDEPGQTTGIIRPTVFADEAGLLAAVSTRAFRLSRPPFDSNLSFRVGDDPAEVAASREAFFGSLGIRMDELAIPGQVHGATIRPVARAAEYPATDALITDVGRVFLCVTVADCVSILLADPVREIVAGVHAGWRGTAAGITRSTVRRLFREYGADPARCLAYLGPSAGPCCYTVGPEVARLFEQRCVLRDAGGVRVDLRQANLAQLLEEGIPEGNIEVSSSCTIHESTRYHSHRRDRERSGRMMAVIGMVR